MAAGAHTPCAILTLPQNRKQAQSRRISSNPCTQAINTDSRGLAHHCHRRHSYRYLSTTTVRVCRQQHLLRQPQTVLLVLCFDAMAHAMAQWGRHRTAVLLMMRIDDSGDSPGGCFYERFRPSANSLRRLACCLLLLLLAVVSLTVVQLGPYFAALLFSFSFAMIYLL